MPVWVERFYARRCCLVIVRKQIVDENRCQELIETAADAVVGADADGRIVLWNAAAASMFGYDRAAILGSPVSNLIPERFRRDYEKGFAAAVKDGRPEVSHLSIRGRHADGREFPVEAAVSISGRGPNAIAFGIVRQVSERVGKLALLQEKERRLRDAEHVASLGSFEWEIVTDALTWSDELYRIFGCDPQDCPSSFDTFLERVHPDDREAVLQNVKHSLKTGAGWAMDERIVRADTGEVRVLASNVKVMLNAHGKVARLCGTCQDVTEQRRAERALAASEARFRHGFEDAPIGMLLLTMAGTDGVITRTNRALRYLLGYTESQLIAMRLSELVVAEDWPLLQATLVRIASDTSPPVQLEVRLRGIDGRTPIVVSAAARIGGPEAPSMLILHLEDITERKMVEDELRHRAVHDALTGLANRDLLLDRLGSALARAERSHSSVAVLFIDLDNFKLINDTIGHVAGDEILRTVAKRLLAVERSGDTAARVGGDEFVVVCDNIMHDEEILSIARRIADAVSVPMSMAGADFIVTVSIGVAVGHGRLQGPEQLLRDADLAMYRAKQHGRNTIDVFDETLRRYALDRVEIERELRAALQKAQIVPYYQPIIALDTGRIAGFEALARWHHPERGLLLPHEFLAVAEDAHLIIALGSAMLQAACKQLSEWSKIAGSLGMAINLSLRQLDGHFAGVLQACLDASGIPPDALYAEVTESVLLDVNKSAIADLHEVARLGVRLGIDDFGTGYSSLVYLKRFPVQFVKIDRSFVDGLPNDQEDAAIVKAIVRLGQSLGLTTTAEGVETAEQLEHLRRLDCSYAQGNFIAPPLPPAECTEMLATRPVLV